jgi:hypothetical protein
MLFFKISEKSYRNKKKKEVNLQINQMSKDKTEKKHEFKKKKTNDLIPYTMFVG